MNEEIIKVGEIELAVHFEVEPEDKESGVGAELYITEVYDTSGGEQDIVELLDEDIVQQIEDQIWNMKRFGKDL